MAAFVESSWASAGSKKGGWEEVEDSKLMLELMLSSVDRNIAAATNNAMAGQLETLDLLGAAAVPSRSQLVDTDAVDCSTSPPLSSDVLDLDTPLPPGWHKCLDLQTGRVYYLQNNGSSSTINSTISSSSRKVSKVAITSSCIGAHSGHMLNIKESVKQAVPMIPKRTCSRPEACRNSTNVNIFGVNLNSVPLQLEAAVQECAGSFNVCDKVPRAVLEMTTVGCANCLMFVMLSKSDPRCPNCGSYAMLDFAPPPAPVAKRGKHSS